MLPQRFLPIDAGSIHREPWDAYVQRLGLPEDEAIRQFFRQVVYDHHEHFNEHYPDFHLSAHRMAIERWTARRTYDEVRYFKNEPMDWWGVQFEEFEARDQDYLVFQAMRRTGTPPFPPVLIESSGLVDKGWRVYGRPYHLIEGTHRVSYLRHMLEKGLIRPESEHDFLVLRALS